MQSKIKQKAKKKPHNINFSLKKLVVEQDNYYQIHELSFFNMNNIVQVLLHVHVCYTVLHL
jgi:tRNA/tmRNA/rRNA uracil-C5-methylase (TrmA/RlmC/RlmD family)